MDKKKAFFVLFFLIATSVESYSKEKDSLSLPEKYVLSFNLAFETLGIKYKGKIIFFSFSPLVLGIKAEKLQINLEDFVKFLTKVGYIEKKYADKISEIKKINASGIKLYLDSGKGDLSLVSNLLQIEKSQIKDINLSYSRTGIFDTELKEASVQLNLIYKLMIKNQKVKKLFNNFLERLRLKELKTEGNLTVLSLKLKGNLKDINTIDVFFKVKGKDLKLKAISNNRKNQLFIINNLDADITVEKGKPKVDLRSINIVSPEKGSAKIKGTVKVPLKKTEISCYFDSFRIFDSKIRGAISKKNEVCFDLSLSHPSVRISSKGKIKLLKKHALIRINKSVLLFQNLPKDSKFNFNFLLNLDSEAKIDLLRINNITIEDILLYTRPTKKGLVFSGNAKICDMNLSLGGILNPENIISQLEIKGVDLDLTSFIACFSKELPVFLKGNLYLSGSFLIKGNSLRSIINKTEGDFIATIDKLYVYRVSCLDPRLGFFLDILRIAKIKPADDSLMFKKCTIKGVLREGNLLLEKLSFIGSPISAWGKGSFLIGKKRLKISCVVKTVFGVSRSVKINRILGKEI